ncbi:SMI1/KNR4 family protein [Nocardia sp. NPDC049149]|uniref:SMI1/KNR4 family protein n=1 Tax=Nocardia sp. NPDC049149 TaxID=3364315 RepID=UPI00372366A2
MTHDWSDVRERIARLAAAPGADQIFGASGHGHGWRLEPPLRPAELSEIEDQLGVELPGEYRSFLLTVGRGGAGPAYGVFPVRQLDGRWQWDGDGAEITALETLSQPFPHVAAFNPADGLPGPPVKEAFDSPEAFGAAEDAYWDDRYQVIDRPEHSVGLVYLCHLGCAYREALVVSGQARGQMWADERAGDGGFLPVIDDAGTPVGFAAWYRKWLDNSEAQLTKR